MKSDTDLRVLTEVEVNAVSGANSELLDAVGGGMAKGLGDNVLLGDTVYQPNGGKITLIVVPIIK